MKDGILSSDLCEDIFQIFNIFSQAGFGVLIGRLIGPETADQDVVRTDGSVMIDQAGQQFLAFGVGEIQRYRTLQRCRSI